MLRPRDNAAQNDPPSCDFVAFGLQNAIAPVQAAKCHGMSRTHLYELLDNGTSAFHWAGGASSYAT